jgi:hypothetical protein
LGARMEQKPFDGGRARYVSIHFSVLVTDVANIFKVILNPAWSAFIGCHMTRNVLADILDGGEWENPEDIEEPEDLVSCLPRIQGVLVKKAGQPCR